MATLLMHQVQYQTAAAITFSMQGPDNDPHPLCPNSTALIGIFTGIVSVIPTKASTTLILATQLILNLCIDSNNNCNWPSLVVMTVIQRMYSHALFYVAKLTISVIHILIISIFLHAILCFVAFITLLARANLSIQL